ncbi:PREDICTED: centrosomal protein of 44 kDa [Cyprinodon variegatus]|uniref:centrosomal protein of 44 kDa n=1 Tax=Cyprinodon variegatus TaxID=28743 RepID=UPI0007429B5D|nr:PREDICTED: centrosomal protein of 44 kDa [Cyprinodon variegatus]
MDPCDSLTCSLRQVEQLGSGHRHCFHTALLLSHTYHRCPSSSSAVSSDNVIIFFIILDVFCFCIRLSKGDPSTFLPILSFTLTSFSAPFAEQLVAAGLEMTGKTDLRFTDALYKVLRDIFHYKPVLSKQQFLQWGFSQRKISFVCDVINLVLQRHKQLNKPRLRCPAPHRTRKEAPLTATDADAFQNEGDVLLVSRESWEDLTSRVVLLEAKLELRNAQPLVPLQSSLPAMDVSQDDLKESLQRIADKMKNTSSLLKNKPAVDPDRSLLS